MNGAGADGGGPALHLYDLELLGEPAGGGVVARHSQFSLDGDERALDYARRLGEQDFARVVDFELCRGQWVEPGDGFTLLGHEHTARVAQHVWTCLHPMGDAHEDLFCEALGARGEVMLRVVEEHAAGATLEVTQGGRGGEAAN